MQEDCKPQPHNLMPIAEQYSLKTTMAFPSNLFPPCIKCKHRSNVALNQKAYSEDLGLPSSGSIQHLQNSPANQSRYDFCRWSICSISYFKGLSGWWCVPNRQLHRTTSFLVPHTSLTDWKTAMQDAMAVFLYY